MNAVALVEMERPSVSLSLPKNLPFEQWVEMGRRLCASSQVINWHIGDWWAFGNHRYGARAKSAAEGVFGLSFGTLANIASVARAFEPSRRHEVVSFAHHQEVAALPPEQADALLAKAETELLSTRELRREVSAIRTADRTERKRDVIDIRPVREQPEPETFSRDEMIVELATELGKHRALSGRESAWLETAMYRLSRDGIRQTEEWGGEQDVELIGMLKEGQRPKHIAPAISRTEGAIWRRIFKLGGLQRILGEGSVQEWPIRKV
jgi:hypothetical protein